MKKATRLKKSAPTYSTDSNSDKNSPLYKECDLNSDTSQINMDSDSIVDSLDTGSLEHSNYKNKTPVKDDYENTAGCIDDSDTAGCIDDDDNAGP